MGVLETHRLSIPILYTCRFQHVTNQTGYLGNISGETGVPPEVAGFIVYPESNQGQCRFVPQYGQ